MVDLYWGCLIGGLVFGLVSFLFGDFLGDALDGAFDAISIDGLDFLHPMTIVSGITVFGGIGLMLSKFTGLETVPVGLISGGGALLFSILMFFVYVKPMKNTESSIGFSVKELVGRTAEVTIPIPENGYGEVVLKLGVQSTYQIAASHDNVPIPVDTIVVVVEVRESVMYVTSLEESYG